MEEKREIEVPYSEEELREIADTALTFADHSLVKDSLGRYIAWAGMASAVLELIREERIHNFTFPSPHNSNWKEEE